MCYNYFKQMTKKKLLSQCEKLREKLDLDLDQNSLGYQIDQLICADLKNWENKEVFFNPITPIKEANTCIIAAFQANKIRNQMITKINEILHHGPSFHFRNYHNY